MLFDTGYYRIFASSQAMKEKLADVRCRVHFGELQSSAEVEACNDRR